MKDTDFVRAYMHVIHQPADITEGRKNSGEIDPTVASYCSSYPGGYVWSVSHYRVLGYCYQWPSWLIFPNYPTRERMEETKRHAFENAMKFPSLSLSLSLARETKTCRWSFVIDVRTVAFVALWNFICRINWCQ